MAGKLLGEGTGETHGCRPLRRRALAPSVLARRVVPGCTHPPPGPEREGPPYRHTTRIPARCPQGKDCPTFLPSHHRTPLMITFGSPSPRVEIYVYRRMSEFMYSHIRFKSRAFDIRAQGQSANLVSGMSLGSHFLRRRWSHCCGWGKLPTPLSRPHPLAPQYPGMSWSEDQAFGSAVDEGSDSS